MLNEYHHTEQLLYIPLLPLPFPPPPPPNKNTIRVTEKYQEVP